MILRELRIEQLPGITGKFSVRGEPGLNLIVGPNGSGKTSLCRAALGLLWPGDDDRGVVASTWEDAGAKWTASRAAGGLVTWQRDGQPAPAPDLPLATKTGSFRLGVLDLLKPAADATDNELAQAIRRQLAGGYDLERLLDAQTVSGREGHAKNQTLSEARKLVEKQRHERDTLEQQEARLAGLRLEWAEARTAETRAKALQAVQDVVTARARFTAADKQLTKKYSASMAELHAHHGERLDDLLRQRQKAIADRDQARRDAAEADRKMAASDLPADRADASLIAAARSRLQNARRLDDQARSAAQDLAGAEKKLTSATNGLTPWGLPETDVAVDAAALRAEVATAHDLLAGTAERDGWQRLLDRPLLQPSDVAGYDPKEYVAAHQALLQWLLAGDERRLPVSGTVIAVGLLVATYFLKPWLLPWSTAWPGWLVLASGMALLLLSTVRVIARPKSRRARRDYRATGLEEPSDWRPDNVRRHLDFLLASEAEITGHQQRNELREQIAQEQQRAATSLEDREATVNDAAAAVDAAERLHRNAAYHQALADRNAARARRDQIHAEVTTLLQGVDTDLAPFFDVTSLDVDSLTAALDDLERRLTAHHEAEIARRRADENQVAATDQIERFSTDLTRLFTTHGVATDDELRHLVSLLPRYRQDAATVEEARAALRIRTEALEILDPSSRAEADAAQTWPAARLTSELEQAMNASASAAKLRDEIVKIETRLEAAASDTTLDDAVDAQSKARRELAAVRQEVRDKALRRLLLQRLQGMHRQLVAPPVLNRAIDLFHKFTQGRYTLTVAEHRDETFRAIDVRTGEGLALHQLSDGTRAQLLLAARLAYLAEAERGTRVPIFLDESLTASDALRFGAVADAVLDLIRDEDRQVFYLTCDQADVDAWQRARTARGLRPAPVTELASIQRAATAATAEQLQPAPTFSVPAPRPDEDATTYAVRVGVPRLDVHELTSAVHVWYVLDRDVTLLQTLLAGGIEYVGQLDEMVEVLVTDRTMTRSQQAQVQIRRRILEEFRVLCATGRGRAIPPGAILEHSGIQSSLLTGVESIRDEVHGDAEQLLASLEQGRVRGLRQKTKDELTNWLHDQGFLDRRPRLTRDQVWTAVAKARQADLAGGQLDLVGLRRLIDSWWRAVEGD